MVIPLEAKKLLLEKGISGLGDAPPGVLRVYVETEADITKLPSFIAGFSVEPIISGRFFALQNLQLLQATGKYRPAPGGCSIGHINITAGTLGSRVFDRVTGKRMILSNNHVLANSNLGKVGDAILQPGPYDGGTDPIDRIALLERFVEIKPSPEENLVDTALALPLNDFDLSNEILDIGVVSNMTDIFLGQAVKKSGRTSGYTEGIIQDINATIKVYGYPFPEEYAIFRDQIITSMMGQPGDSGSLLCDMNNNAVALLFAGSDTLTAFNKISNIVNTLNIDFGAPVPPPSPISLIMMLPFIFAVPAFWLGKK